MNRKHDNPAAACLVGAALFLLVACGCDVKPQPEPPSVDDLEGWMEVHPNPVPEGTPCAATYTLANNNLSYAVAVDSVYDGRGSMRRVPDTVLAGDAAVVWALTVSYTPPWNEPYPHPFSYRPVFFTSFGVVRAEEYTVSVLRNH